MTYMIHVVAVVLAIMTLAIDASAQSVPDKLTLSDFQSKSARKLGQKELHSALAGASLTRIVDTGSTHRWKIDADGTFWLSSNNVRDFNSPHARAEGKWNVADDGKLCIEMQWIGVRTGRGGSVEKWCRFVFQTDDGMFMSSSDSSLTARAFKFELSR